jgi:hypothetical protein
MLPMIVNFDFQVIFFLFWHKRQQIYKIPCENFNSISGISLTRHGVLTDYIIEIARAQGYRKITATFLKTNGAMRRMFEHKRFVIRSGEDGADAAELGL